MRCSIPVGSHLNVLTFFPHNRGMLRRSRCVLIFLYKRGPVKEKVVFSHCKDSVVESGVCRRVSEFDITGTGAVYIKAYGMEEQGTLCFFSPTLGLTIRVEGRRQRLKKNLNAPRPSEHPPVPLGAAATSAGANGAAALWHHTS